MAYTGGMASSPPPRRDFQGLEQRRRKAARLFAAGKMILAAIAGELKCSRQSVSRWYAAWKRDRTGGLRGAGRAGRKPQLNAPQLQVVERALRQGARAHGFGTELWTLPRVAAVIERLTGVKYHPGHVWKILGSIDWTLQRPTTRARERNEQARQYWLTQRWPAVKKTLSANAPGSSSRTKAASRSVPPCAGPGPRKGRRPS